MPVIIVEYVYFDCGILTVLQYMNSLERTIDN